MVTRSSLPKALLKRLSGFISLRRRAGIVAQFVPSRHWYRAATYFSRWHAWLTAALGGGSRAVTEAAMLDSWLVELTLFGPYPIPWRGVGTEVLRQDPSKRGVMFCWTHVPLFRIPLHALMQMGCYAPVVVADPGNIVGDHEFVVPGMAERLQAIPLDLYVLVKMRTVLHQGGSIACLADYAVGEALSPNVLRLAGRMGSRVIFLWAERRKDGTIDVHFMDPPRPLCGSEEDIAVNIEFLRRENRRLLGPLGIGGSPLDEVGFRA